MGPKTIVVVDDESHMLDTIRFILEANGYTAVTARGCEHFLDKPFEEEELLRRISELA